MFLSCALNSTDMYITNKPNWLKNTCVHDDAISKVDCEYSGEYFRMEIPRSKCSWQQDISRVLVNRYFCLTSWVSSPATASKWHLPPWKAESERRKLGFKGWHYFDWARMSYNKLLYEGTSRRWNWAICCMKVSPARLALRKTFRLMMFTWMVSGALNNGRITHWRQY